MKRKRKPTDQWVRANVFINMGRFVLMLFEFFGNE
jgi:hypothetical protein